MQPLIPGRLGARFAAGLNAFTERLWVPLRQMGQVATLHPDWESAPATFRGLAWYAVVLIMFLAANRIVQLDAAEPAAAARELVAAVHAFLQYTLNQLVYVCVFAAIGRWFVFWNCVAKKSSPVQLLGMTYTVSAIDQLALLLIRLGTGDSDGNSVLVGVKNLVAMGLALMVLVDFFRPRRPTKPRRKKADAPAPTFGETAPGRL